MGAVGNWDSGAHPQGFPVILGVLIILGVPLESRPKSVLEQQLDF